MAGKSYFAAYAEKILASGSTFFDDAVFFSLRMLQIKVPMLAEFLAANPVQILAGSLTRNEMLTQ